MTACTYERNYAPRLPTWKAFVARLLGAAGAAVLAVALAAALVVAAAAISIIALPIVLITGAGRGSIAADRPSSEGNGSVIDAEYEVVETPARSGDGSERGSRRRA